MATEKRLIDANEIPYHKSGFPKGDGFDSGLDWAFREDIEKLPTVDAVPVVRCKDCKWYQVRQWDNGKPKYDCRKTHALLDVKQDDFCSYGERRTDNG